MIYDRDKLVQYLVNEKADRSSDLERFAIPYVLKSESGQYMVVQPSGSFHPTNIALHSTDGEWKGGHFDAHDENSIITLANDKNAVFTSKEQVANAIEKIDGKVEHVGWAPSDYYINAYKMPAELAGSKIHQPDWGENVTQDLNPKDDVLVVVSSAKSGKVVDCYANSKADFKDWAQVGKREVSGEKLVESLPEITTKELEKCQRTPDTTTKKITDQPSKEPGTGISND